MEYEVKVLVDLEELEGDYGYGYGKLAVREEMVRRRWKQIARLITTQEE